jgi:hypothetical protein
MIRSKLQIAAVIGVFLSTLMLFAPASLIAGVIERQAPQLQFERITGTLWKGAIEGAQIDGYRLGAVGFQFTPSSLFSGSFGYRVQGPVNGPLTFSGRVTASPFGQVIHVVDAEASFNLGSITRYTLFGSPYQGDLDIRIDHLQLSRNGCKAAAGRVETDVLDGTAQRYFQQPLTLGGDISCADERLQLDLAGDNALGRIEITASIAPSLSYEVRASVRAQRPEVLASLKSVGFRNAGDAMRYEAVGALKGPGS